MILLILAALQAQASPDSLRLPDAIRLALAQRGEVHAAAAQVAAARAAFRQAGTIPNPVGRWSYTDDPPREHASIEQPLDWLLTRGPARGAARASRTAMAFDSAQRVANVAAEVRIAFNRLLAARDHALLAEERQQLADSLLAIADRRLAAGDISRFERDQVALERSRNSLGFSETRQALAIARADLTRTIGLPADTRLPPVAGTLSEGLERAVAPAGIDESPVLFSALADSAAARRQVTATARARIPFPAFEIGADWADPAAPDKRLLLVGVSLPIPLWHQGGSDLALARANAAGAAARLRETRASLRASLAGAEAALTETAARVRIIQDSLLPAARRLREQAEQAYAQGETGMLPLLEAVRSERDIAVLRLDALTAWQEARAEWSRLLGIIE